jgi:hypothetical protein
MRSNLDAIGRDLATEEIAMPMGHLMLGLLGGVLAFGLSIWIGEPLWLGVLLYTGVGNLVFMGSVALEVLLRRMRRPPKPPRRRARPFPVGRMAAQPVRVRI